MMKSQYRLEPVLTPKPKDSIGSFPKRATKAVKPLFIPLKTEYYRAFERGDKTTEYRLAGKRWNVNVCAIGRPVVLARGYSTPDRMNGTITAFLEVPLSMIHGGLLRIAISNCYQKAQSETLIACISIEVKR